MPILVRLTPRRFRDRVHQLSSLLGGIGLITLMWFLFQGITLYPLHCITTKPEAPISRFYAWGSHHLGARWWMLVHLLVTTFFIMLYFEHLAILKWKKKQDAEHAPPAGRGEAPRP